MPSLLPLGGLAAQKPPALAIKDEVMEEEKEERFMEAGSR